MREGCIKLRNCETTPVYLHNSRTLAAHDEAPTSDPALLLATGCQHNALQHSQRGRIPDRNDRLPHTIGRIHMCKRICGLC